LPADYPSNYGGPEPIIEQIQMLGELLKLDPVPALCYTKQLPPLPEHAEGWFAIPSLSAVEARFQDVDADELHCKGIWLILNTMRNNRNFYLYNDPTVITSEDLRRTARTSKALSLVMHNQPGDILLVAAQLGMRHRGRSVLEVCEALLPNEYGLDSVAVGSILLTHPGRLSSWGDLAMVCAGDVPPSNCGPISSIETVCFQMIADFLELGLWYSAAEEPGMRGAVTGFLPAGDPPI
jgi:hypothetical protein